MMLGVNSMIALVGALLLSVAVIREISDHHKAVRLGKVPQDRDIQIRKQGDIIWIYEYVSNPGWRLVKSVPTMEEAQEIKRQSENTRVTEEIVE